MMAKAKAKTAESDPVALPPLKRRMIKVTVIGDTSLITHKFSDRAKKALLDKQTGKASAGREKRDPERDYEESKYLLPDGSCGIPGAAFKNAMVRACTQTSGFPMTRAAVAFHIVAELVKIKGEPNMREDIVRLETGVPYLRYRAEFSPWSCEVPIVFNENVISLEQVINLVELAGMVGVGDWRPFSKKNYSGNHGMFHVSRK
jgi:hypothetical protein